MSLCALALCFLAATKFQHDDAPEHKVRHMKTELEKLYSSDLNLTEYRKTTPTTPGLLTQHHCLISVMLLWLNEHNSPKLRFKI